MRIRRVLPIALLACAPALVPAVTAQAQAAARTRTVALKGIAFSPAALTIRRGDRVRFSWRDGGIRHNVAYAGGKRFRGASTRSSGSYVVTFKRAGLYRYQCTLHLGMKGSIRVR